MSVFLVHILYLSPDLPSPVVMVSTASVGPMAVGERLELTCSVTVEEHLTPSAELSIVWSGWSVEGSGVIESDTRAVNETTSERTLIFSSLNTSHGGQYTCQAVVYIDMISLVKTGMDIAELMLQSEILTLKSGQLMVCVCVFVRTCCSPQASGDGDCLRERVSVRFSSLPLLLHPPSLCGHLHHHLLPLDHSWRET